MNQLEVNQQQNILSLHRRGWSRRTIARELGLDRGTVRKYVSAAVPAKPATQAQTGSAGLGWSKPTMPQTGPTEVPESKPATQVNTGSGGALSKCQPFAERITGIEIEGQALKS